MTWEELDAYAGGWVCLVGFISEQHHLGVQGVYSNDKKAVHGEFLRMDFRSYWVFSPEGLGTPMNALEYRTQMAAWLDRIVMLAPQRNALMQSLAELHFLDVPAFEDFTDLLLENPATAFEIRRDLVAMLPNVDELVPKVQAVAEQFSMELALKSWGPEPGTPLQ